jgi:uncharacterized membrane protein (GlpM family)
MQVEIIDVRLESTKLRIQLMFHTQSIISYSLYLSTVYIEWYYSI